MVQLDILRGVAILLVLFTHSVVSPAESGSLQPVLRYLRYLSPSGVDLFFVLSGFLVGGLLFKELLVTGRLDVRRFLIRRGFRIWPSYFVFLGAIFLWLVLRENVSMSAGLRLMLPNLLHVQNYFGSPREHTWSLAVEEHFYLVLPLLLMLLTVQPRSHVMKISALPWIAVGVFALCALLRLQAYADPPSFNPHFATHLRIDSLFFGVLLAYFHHFEPDKLEFAARHPQKLLLLGALLLLPYPALVMEDQGNLVVGTLGFAMLYVGYGCLLLAVVNTPLGAGRIGRRLDGFSARAVALIGYYSYPIYLWHLDATKPMHRLLGLAAMEELPAELRWLCAFAGYLLVAVAIGALFGVLLERPSLALRDRLFPSFAPPRTARSGAVI